jgi:hypothetical protein
VVCVIKNTATLAGSLFTLHCTQIHIDLPTLSDEDKDVWSSFCHFVVFPFLAERHFSTLLILKILV